MEPTNRPLNTLAPGEVDAYIDTAIDELFVPKRSTASPAAAPEPTEPPQGEAAAPPGPGHVLEALQEALLSLEWEVSDRNIRSFEREVRALGQQFSADRHVGAVVQMALGVSKYLTAVGEVASPLGVQFPTAVLRTLEVLLRERATPAAERKAAVEQLLEKYRRLQAEVRRPAARAPEAAPAAAEPPHAAPEQSRAPAAPAVPVEELEPEAADSGPVEELEPEAAEELEPEAPAAFAADAATSTLAPAQRPPEAGLAPAEEATAETAPDLEAAAGEERPSETLEAEEAPEDEREAPAAAPEAAAPEPEVPPAPLSPAPEAGAGPGDGTRQLVACLEVLRADLREGSERVFRAAAAGPEALDAELTQFRHLLDDGLASALHLAQGPGALPAAVPADLKGDLERVRNGLAELSASLRAIEERLDRAAGAGAASPGPHTPRPQAPAPPAEEAQGSESAPSVCLVSVGGAFLEVPAQLVVNAYVLGSGQAARIRERGYATLKDFRKPFRSIKNGLAGPLSERSGGELSGLRFAVAAGSPEPHAAVLLSDGANHAALLTDAVPDRTPRPRGCSPLFRLEPGEPAA
ncbi:MAG: hypothetical protein AB1578_08585 [Thermodesulfobacteriota bacterium]